MPKRRTTLVVELPRYPRKATGKPSVKPGMTWRRAVHTAIPETDVLDYLQAHFGYGTDARPLPAEVYWITS